MTESCKNCEQWKAINLVAKHLSDSPHGDLGPADGQQKIRLMEELYAKLEPVPDEEAPRVPCQWIPGEAQPSCGFDPDCPECRNRCPGCGCDEHIGSCNVCGCLDSRTEEQKAEAKAEAKADGVRDRVKHSGPETEFCVPCPSGEHERVTTEQAEPDSLPRWLFQRFATAPVWNGPTVPKWTDLDETDQSYWAHQAAAVRRAVTRGGFKVTTEES